jgi:molybdenum cofactor cytidylyltransferase
MLAALILAAGESRRMGSAKALLLYNDRTFVEHLLDVTRHSRIGVQRVVLGAEAEYIRERLGLDSSLMIENPDWQQGQLSSIQAGIRSLAETPTEGVLLCLVDHPLISSTLVKTLIESFDASGKAIVLPSYLGRRGHPLIFASRLYDELLAAPAETGARAVVWKHDGEVLEVPTEEQGVLINLNDPDAFQREVGGG